MTDICRYHNICDILLNTKFIKIEQNFRTSKLSIEFIIDKVVTGLISTMTFIDLLVLLFASYRPPPLPSLPSSIRQPKITHCHPGLKLCR